MVLTMSMDWQAQHLARPITTSEKLLRTAQHHRIYIALEGCQFKPIGFGKVGKKRIFHLVSAINRYNIEVKMLVMLTPDLA